MEDVQQRRDQLDQRRLTWEQERERIDLSEVSNAMVRLYKEMFGRGPTRARSDLAGPDTLVSTLENTFTPAEANMVKAGEHQRLRDLRLYFQHSSERQFVGTVEHITGRKVRGFTSGIDVWNDIATEVFYLEPLGSPGDGGRGVDELSP